MEIQEQEKLLGERLAIAAPVLYLLNLLLLPGLAFLILVLIYIKYRHIDHQVARVQLQQNFIASICAGIAILGVSLIIITIGGFDSMYSWMIMLTYAVSIHAALVLCGALSLAKGINKKTFFYPGLANFSNENGIS